MSSYLIFLKFYYIIINLKDHKLLKLRIFGSPRRKKNQNIQYFFQNKLLHELECGKIRQLVRYDSIIAVIFFHGYVGCTKSAKTWNCLYFFLALTCWLKREGGFSLLSSPGCALDCKCFYLINLQASFLVLYNKGPSIKDVHAKSRKLTSPFLSALDNPPDCGRLLWTVLQKNVQAISSAIPRKGLDGAIQANHSYKIKLLLWNFEFSLTNFTGSCC